MRVALTGGSGFIGRHLAVALTAAGHHVVAVDWTREGIRADDFQGAEVLVHLGYVMPRSTTHLERLAEEMAGNCAGTARLLARAEEAGVTGVVFASSASVYAPGPSPRPEGAPVRTDVPYALAKVILEETMLASAVRTGGRACILRLATVYGPGETVPRAIPNFIRAVLAGRSPQVDAASRFEPVNVTDVVRAFVLAVESEAHGIFNVGTGRAVSGRDVAEMVIRAAGARVGVETLAAVPAQSRPICDVSRARRELGFAAIIPLEVGISAEVEWFRARAAPVPALG